MRTVMLSRKSPISAAAFNMQPMLSLTFIKPSLRPASPVGERTCHKHVARRVVRKQGYRGAQ